LNLQTSGPDPDLILELFYGCGSSLNWDGYCNPEIDKLIEQQSREADPDRCKQVLRKIKRTLAADDARPIIFYTKGGTCRQPYVNGLTLMVNSIFNGWRMEDVWLDKSPVYGGHAVAIDRADEDMLSSCREPCGSLASGRGGERWDPIWCVASA
jgi:ABC-type transport system substrate-binding protein